MNSLLSSCKYVLTDLWSSGAFSCRGLLEAPKCLKYQAFRPWNNQLAAIRLYVNSTRILPTFAKSMKFPSQTMSCFNEISLKVVPSFISQNMSQGNKKFSWKVGSPAFFPALHRYGSAIFNKPSSSHPPPPPHRYLRKSTVGNSLEFVDPKLLTWRNSPGDPIFLRRW